MKNMLFLLLDSRGVKFEVVWNCSINMEGILYTKNYVNFEIKGETTTMFEGAKNANRCLPGDLVVISGEGCQLVSRAKYTPIVGTIHLTGKIKYGMTSKGHFKYLFVPYSPSYPPMIVGCSLKDSSQNRVVLVDFVDWTEQSQFPFGNIRKIIGVSGDIEAEKEGVLWQYCPYKHSKGIYRGINSDISRLFIEDYTFNIDPPGCQDIDDVLSIRCESSLENIETWILTISISDVATIVAENSEEDQLARLISQTYYQDGKAKHPMLDPSISEDICSLIPNKRTNALSLIIKIQWNLLEKKVVSKEYQWAETIVLNQRSFTYEEFDLYQSDEKEFLYNVFEVNDSHALIENAMKLYNIEASKKLCYFKNGILRRHTEANSKLLEQYKSIDMTYSFLANHSAEYCLTTSDNKTHSGIGTDTYCHATSPIRRYADLVNQRVLKQIATEIPFGLISHLNLRSKDLKRYEKDLVFIGLVSLKKKELDGKIIDIIEKDENIKLKIFISSYKILINMTYKCIGKNTIISKDENKSMDICIGQSVVLQFAVHIEARNWKNRVIFQLM